MAVFSWDNYADDATIVDNTPDPSPGATTAVLGVAKLKTRQLGDVFRRTFDSPAVSPSPDLILDFDLGSAKKTDLIAVLNHTMSGMSYTLAFGSSSGANDIGTETGTFWTGTADDPKNDFIYLATGHTARYIRLTVAVTVATVDIGRIWFDDAWSANLSLDFSIGVDDSSTMVDTRGGSVYTSERKRRKLIHCSAHALSTANVIGTDADTDSFMSMDLKAGSSGEVIVLPDTSSTRLTQRLGVYGHLSRNEPTQFIDKGNAGYIASKRFTVREDF